MNSEALEPVPALVIKQSYHGTGSKEGYKWRVYTPSGKKLGELEYLPSKCGRGDVVSINNQLFKITKEYDSKNPRHEKSEVMFYELVPYKFEADYDLGLILQRKGFIH
ncbi:hypothetical protein M3649_03865 [Ureibacillus chungkukjangi]|uniref:hypothetical protein n=1 Tax=Ureibacillus chungkukjangi TaxID=1202712 RepID=UPI002041EACA|nr:hypothetical protein [Ureibacillus chungkukjangi]MCM3387268.1 hypothetical protein [Ureibacillus chungkukjangi]